MLLEAKHNNGFLRDKIAQLDAAVGAVTDSTWRKTGA